MKYMIFYIITVCVLVYVALYHTPSYIEDFTDKRGLNEGALSYRRRMFTKYVHRPAKLKLRRTRDMIIEKIQVIKRTYL